MKFFNNFTPVEIVIFWLDICFLVLGFFGNSMVIYVISRHKKLRKKSNYPILSLACADFLLALVGASISIIVSFSQVVSLV